MTEMIERVAEAIFHNGIGEVVWTVATDEQKETAIRQARAAIEAMREPTEPMVEAGNHGLASNGVDAVEEDDSITAWKAMIAEALK